MAYVKMNYQPGDVLSAEQVNKIQDAIIQNEENIEGLINGSNGETISHKGTVNSESELYEILNAEIATMPNASRKTIAASLNFSGLGGGYFIVDIYKPFEGYAYADASTYDRCWLRFACRNNVWQPMEWVNPPMKNGVIYRTTKRFGGKPVYATQFNCTTAIPTTGGEKWITMPSVGLWDAENQGYFTLMIDTVVSVKGFIAYAGAVTTTFDDSDLVSNYYVEYGGIGSGCVVIDYASTAYSKIQDWGGDCSVYAIVEFTGWY